MNKHIEYKTHGTCSRMIIVDVEDGVITDCSFVGGCSGNTQGVGRLALGQKIDDIIARLEGIQCRGGTSCPDQFAKALKHYKYKKEHGEEEIE